MKADLPLHMQRRRIALKEYLDILKDNILFYEFESTDIESILNCLSGRVMSYEKSDTILLCGNAVRFIGIVLSGSVNIINEDIHGNINILARLGVNEVFAEAFACAGIKESPVTVQAIENCNVLFIDCKRIVKSCHNACAFHASLIENMLGLVARKNIGLNQKIQIMSKKTTREKLLMFFEIQRRIFHSKKFFIPYNREALAHYIGVDRSAMSRELSNMRNERLIKFKKNEFEIL